jgi:hypothetical protein
VKYFDATTSSGWMHFLPFVPEKPILLYTRPFSCQYKISTLKKINFSLISQACNTKSADEMALPNPSVWCFIQADFRALISLKLIIWNLDF